MKKSKIIMKVISVCLALVFMGCNNFKSVKIGDQEWMTENLSVTNYNNGDEIFQAKTNEDLQQSYKEQRGTWCYINADGDVTTEKTKYGKLYNWFAINDSRGLAPKGWHIPTIEEWRTLYKHLGGDESVLKVIKNTSGWINNGTDESGFSAYPTNSDGYATYWSNTGSSNGLCFMIYENYIHFGDRQKATPMGVRCVKGY